MQVLGVNAFTHDVAVAVINDTEPLFLVEEERYSRRKHHDGFIFGGNGPEEALAEAINYGHPLRIAHSRRTSFAAASHYLAQHRFMAYARSLDSDLSRTSFFEHHACHAATAFFSSPFLRSYICTLDSQGDGLSTTVSVGEGDDLERVAEVPASASICSTYSYITELLRLGRRAEGSLMALAGLEEPKSDPQDIFVWTGHTFRTPRLEHLERRAHRATGSVSASAQVAADVQNAFEIAVETMLDDLCSDQDIRTLALSGGGFLNCSLNRRLRQSPRWDDVYIPPCAGDSGCALGAALLGLEHPSGFELRSAFYGSSTTPREVRNLIDHWGLTARAVEVEEVAELVSEGLIGGFFTGRMEFGPRALGHRSIIGDPRSSSTRDRINQIKHRQPWRPVAPAVTHDSAASYFQAYTYSPYMTTAFDVILEVRDEIPAVVHVDGTARIQSVMEDSDPFSRLIVEFANITGVPVLANTSLNVVSPIARTPADAIATFYTSSLDFLYCEGYLLEKDRTETAASAASRSELV